MSRLTESLPPAFDAVIV
jgi:hypothetical protein